MADGNLKIFSKKNDIGWRYYIFEFEEKSDAKFSVKYVINFRNIFFFQYHVF